jgi:L-alanine-DL-glutamate epimerase-like enolase superfamily enzyme
MQLHVATESWPYKVPFRVSRGAEAALEVIVVTLVDELGNRGRGEAAGVDYDGEAVSTMSAQLESVRDLLAAGDGPGALARLGAGGARNGLDCALWDLKAKRSRQTIWQLLKIDAPRPVVSAITFGIDTREATSALAERYHDWPLIKIKVDAERHIEVIEAVRARCPLARFIVDPNQAWSCALLNRLTPLLQQLGVALIEQPLPRGDDADLRGYLGTIPLAADESLVTRADVPALARLYQVANIKLDKTGGLTEALATARAAAEHGMRIMIGCMAGTSLAMAPGTVIAQTAQFVDLDGPLLHAHDREAGISYHRGTMQLPTPALWG